MAYLAAAHLLTAPLVMLLQNYVGTLMLRTTTPPWLRRAIVSRMVPFATACPNFTTHGAGGSRGPVGRYHPSGTRDLTVREYATLLGLPSDYDLGPEGLSNKTKLLKQNGNMVSPFQAKAMLKLVLELHRRIKREPRRYGREGS